MEEITEQTMARTELQTALTALRELRRRRRKWVGLPAEVRHELDSWQEFGAAVGEYLRAEEAAIRADAK